MTMFNLDTLPLSPGQAILIFGFLIFGILLAINGLFGLVSESRHRAEARVNRRLDMLARGIDPKAVLEALRRNIDANPAWTRYVPGARWLGRQLVQSGMSMTLQRLLLLMAGLTVGVYGTLSMMPNLTGPSTIGLALLFGIVLPVVLVRRKRNARLRRFAEQLPEAIDMLVRSLRVGHPLSAACQMVADELSDPIGTEFGIAVDEMTYGLDLNEAIENLGNRIEVDDLRYLIIAVNIQYGTGGNLAEILAGLGKVIRDRFQMYRKIRAVSAEGRIACTFLTIFPFAVVLAIWIFYKQYYLSVADHPLFQVLAAAGAVLVLLNTVLMRWITNIKV
jgi:tight adherence protein B